MHALITIVAFFVFFYLRSYLTVRTVPYLTWAPRGDDDDDSFVAPF